MTVLYSCHACGIRRREVEVPDRGADEGVVHWVSQTVADALSRDHDRLSSWCHPEKLDEILIPFSDGAELGKPVKH